MYIGVTSDLKKRVWEHKYNLVKGFTEKYGVHSLVYYEQFEGIEQAIIKEKQMKKWKRNWKIKQINRMNPAWDDLYSKII